jgi:hypothetical protein
MKPALLLCGAVIPSAAGWLNTISRRGRSRHAAEQQEEEAAGDEPLEETCDQALADGSNHP